MVPINKSAYKLLLNEAMFEKNPSLITMVKRDDKNFNGEFINMGVSIKPIWPSSVTVFVSGTDPVDYFLFGPRHHAVSQRAREVIGNAVGTSVEFLPLNVVNKDSEDSIGQYWAINILNNIDALDWDHTVWNSDEIPLKKKDAHLDIIKPAFKAHLIEGQHMFLLRVRKFIKSGIYISATLKKQLKSKGTVAGMDFMPIKVV
jgi:hypothetical protein